MSNLGDVMLDRWPTIRAALARERKLREALEEYGHHKFMCLGFMNDGPCSCGWTEQRKALLAQPAGEEGSERG